jgi:glycosyltransferase involved in cell wall biosynthesis
VGPLSAEQSRQGCDVWVYYVEKPPAPAIEPDESLVTCRSFPLTLPFSNPGVSRSFWTAINQSVTRFDFVHVHAVWNFPTYGAMRAALKSGVPYMVAPQGSFEPWALRQSRWQKKAYASLLEIPLLNRAACLQAVTSREAEQFRRTRLRPPAIVIPNGVDERNFKHQAGPLAQRLGLPPNQRTLLSLSRLHPKKGVDFLIQTFERFSHDRGGVTLVIAGGDAGSGYEVRLKSLVSELGIGAQVRFVGEVDGREKIDMLLGADAFALLSHSEGLPVAVLEAMAAGLPVIITEDCNLPDVAERDAGMIVSDDPDETVAALAQLFDEPGRLETLGQNGRQLVSDKFTWGRIAEQTIKTYQRARANAI